jgi:plasmid stability protein
MATLTIRNLEPEVKQALRERAARRGVSMEEEARQALRLVVSGKLPGRADVAPEESAWTRVAKLRGTHGTFDIELPQRRDLADDPPELR